MSRGNWHFEIRHYLSTRVNHLCELLAVIFWYLINNWHCCLMVTSYVWSIWFIPRRDQFIVPSYLSEHKGLDNLVLDSDLGLVQREIISITVLESLFAYWITDKQLFVFPANAGIQRNSLIWTLSNICIVSLMHWI